MVNCERTVESDISMLIADISHTFRNYMQTRSAMSGLKRSYHRILMHLVNEEPLTQLELSRRTGLSPPTVSVTLQSMEQEGLVSRRSDEKDLRITVVSLTDHGREIDNRIRSLFTETENAMLNNLDETQKDSLRKLLLNVSETLNEHIQKD